MKIVLTGGPSAGKTSIAEVLRRTHSDRIAVVKEAASVLFIGGFPRSDQPILIRCQQRAIYHVQKELEEIGVITYPGQTLICDRGSLDGLAYWPGSEAEFFSAVDSSAESEVARYDWVLHLDTAPSNGYHSTQVRTESEEAAVRINERIKNVWSVHPKRVIIPSSRDFMKKVNITLAVARAILDGSSYDDVVRISKQV